MKEKLFISLAWLPKATVQAALGPVALGKAREALAHYIMAQANNFKNLNLSNILLFSQGGDVSCDDEVQVAGKAIEHCILSISNNCTMQVCQIFVTWFTMENRS